MSNNSSSHADYIYYYNEFDLVKNVRSKKSYYEMEYIYNNKNDWTQIIVYESSIFNKEKKPNLKICRRFEEI